MTRLHQVLLLALLGAAASFVVEDWYRNLNHFGPLATSDWAFRKMTLVADYTWSKVEQVTSARRKEQQGEAEALARDLTAAAVDEVDKKH